jgi:streptogramin lyase
VTNGSSRNPALIGGRPWISVDTGNAGSGYLARVDPATNTVDRILAPGTAFGGGGDILVTAGSVWVIDGYNSAVLRLPSTAFAP